MLKQNSMEEKELEVVVPNVTTIQEFFNRPIISPQSAQLEHTRKQHLSLLEQQLYYSKEIAENMAQLLCLIKILKDTPSNTPRQKNNIGKSTKKNKINTTTMIDITEHGNLTKGRLRCCKNKGKNAAVLAAERKAKLNYIP